MSLRDSTGRRIPEDRFELQQALGLDKTLRTLGQVKMIQAQLAEWVVDVAEAKYPDLRMRDEAEVLRLCHEAAMERWGKKEFMTLFEALNDAERAMLRDADEVMA